MRALIIGGGIGGLSTAICLALRGIEVRLFEQADKFREVGAGLQISPNGMKVLSRMGVELPNAFAPEALEMRDANSGAQIFRLELPPLIERWGAPYYHVHRADLLAGLLTRAKELPIELNLRHELIKIDGAAYFSNDYVVNADVIIGADGVHSKVRKFVAPNCNFRSSGLTVWRGLVPVNAMKSPPPPTACVWKSKGKHIVTTRINGGDTINAVGICAEDAEPALEQNFEASFGGLCAVLNELAGYAEGFSNAQLLSRETPKVWCKGKAVLLGDAAHPMWPSMAQGAVMAIEDAWVLADELNAGMEGAFARYQNRRAKRVAHVVARSYANLNWFHRGGIARVFEDFAFRTASNFAPELILRQLDKVYAHEIARDEI